MGCRRFYLIDMDKVEMGNVGRQILFSNEDIGKFKVEVVKERIRSKNKVQYPHTRNSIQCICHTGSFHSADMQTLTQIDILVGCVDNIETRKELNSFACLYSKIYIDGGSTGFGGQVQLVIPTVQYILQ